MGTDLFAASGFMAGHAAGQKEVTDLLADIRHLPRDVQQSILDARRRELEAKLHSGPEFRRWKHLNSMKEDADFAQATLTRWERGEFTLQLLPHSMAHKLLAAAQTGRIEYGLPGREEESQTDFIPRLKRCVPFVIEHNWAAAFQNAGDFDEGEYPLPFDDTIFEMRADGRHVAAICCQDIRLVAMQLGDGWFVSLWDSEWGAKHWLSSIVRAACIALDAEVAVSEAVRAPERLNRARIKQGKLPMLDYHVIRLNRHSRVAPLPDDDRETGDRRLRLHFVRGHWRHYETHKTWIKWHLRGDPDLGFIDKHYRL